jgi:TatD DNase family protein
VIPAAPRFIDTHAHLDDRQFGDEVGDVIARAAAAGVETIVNIGYRPSVWHTTLALAKRFSNLRYTLGLHPHHADEWSPEVARELRSLLTSEQPVALGEIGLDFYRNLSPADVQERVFREQLDWALEFDLPVIIHQREAERDVMRVLRDAPPELVCVLHSFDGTRDLADLAFEKGYFLGAGGLMTRAKAETVREVLKTARLDRLLLETDSPYLVPAGIKDRRNEPANIPAIAANLAALRGETVETVAAATSQNASRLFKLLLSATTTSTLSAGNV